MPEDHTILLDSMVPPTHPAADLGNMNKLTLDHPQAALVDAIARLYPLIASREEWTPGGSDDLSSHSGVNITLLLRCKTPLRLAPRLSLRQGTLHPGPEGWLFLPKSHREPGRTLSTDDILDCALGWDDDAAQKLTNRFATVRALIPGDVAALTDDVVDAVPDSDGPDATLCGTVLLTATTNPREGERVSACLWLINRRSATELSPSPALQGVLIAPPSNLVASGHDSIYQHQLSPNTALLPQATALPYEEAVTRFTGPGRESILAALDALAPAADSTRSTSGT